MKNTTVYIPRKLQSIIKDISPRFFLSSEFPFRQPGDEARQLLQAAVGLSPHDLEHYSYQLKSTEIETLILCLPFEEEYGAAFIASILKHRANKRLFEIFWPFYQYHYKNDNVAGVAKIIVSHDNNVGAETAALRNLRIFAIGDGFDVLLNKLLTDKTPLGVFAAEEALLVDSPLAERLFSLYFGQCHKDGYILNERRLLRILTILQRAELEQVVMNYILKMDRHEFLQDVNTYILEHWGEPFKSADWAAIPQDLQQKFVEWISYRRLKLHFEKNKVKLRILNNFVPYIRQVQLSGDASFFAADFGAFYIVDDNDISAYSYYVDKDMFESINGDADKHGFEDIKDHFKELTDARGFMIDETEEKFVQLEYENLGRLYITDMLNIKLNVTPDLRPSKSILKKKQRKNSRQ